MPARENRYQAKVIQRLKNTFPGCYVLKNDASYMQGIPDLLVLFRDRWAMLEVKRSLNEDIQPNQMYYVQDLSRLSYAAFICPENEEEVFDDLQLAFRARRQTRASQP